MAIVVHGPDGAAINFADGTDEATITQALAKAYPKGGDKASVAPVLRSAEPSDPKATPAPVKTPPPPHSDFGLGAWEGTKIPLDNASVAVEAGLRKVGVPVNKIDAWLAKEFGRSDGGTASEMRASDIKYLQGERAKGRNPSVMGNIVGSIPATIAATAVTKNPLALGAMMGALESEAPDVRGVASDTTLGAAFGKAGNVAAKGLAAIAKPVFRPAVNKLLAAGVKLTPGQIAGGTPKMIEDATSKTIPVIGDVIDEAHNRAIASANVAAYNRALAPLGETFPKTVPAGHQGVAYLQERFGKAYDAITPKMTIEYDEPLHTELKDIVGHASRNLPPDHAKILGNIVRDEVARPLVTSQRGGTQPFFPSQAGQIAGTTVKTIDTKLNSIYKRYAGSQDPHDQLMAEYISDIKDAIHESAKRFHPELAAQLDKIDQGYAVLARIEPAASKGVGGIFTGAQLSAAARTADTTVRKRASAAGRAHMQDLSDAMQQILRPSISNSGTAARHVVGAGLGAALFGKSLGLSINPLAAGAVAATLAPYTKTGNAVMRAVLTKRPPGAETVRNALRRAAVPASAVVPTAIVSKRNSRLKGSEN